MNLRRRRSAQIHLTLPRLTFLYLELLGGVPVKKKHPASRYISEGAGLKTLKLLTFETQCKSHPDISNSNSSKLIQAGSDCGFATFGKHPTVHPDIVWAKLVGDH